MSTQGAVLSRGRARIGAAVRRDWVASACLAVLLAAAIVAILAPLLAPYDPNLVSLGEANLGPSAEHLLGTDQSGRDLLSRMLYGGRTSLLGPLLVIMLATVIATSVALVAAWFGGWVDHAISAVLDVTFSFPGLLLAIGAVAVFGNGLVAPVVALGIAYTPYIARILRGAALRERRLPYVQALVVQGVSGGRIATLHLLPNIRDLLLAQATLAFGYATIDLAAISFLGLGVQPPTPDWGRMVADGQSAILDGHVAEALYPGLALVVVVVAVTLLGRRLAGATAEVE